MAKKLKLELTDEAKAFFAECGRRGGQSRSAAKKQAALGNMEKALSKRWNKRFKGRLVKADD